MGLGLLFHLAAVAARVLQGEGLVPGRFTPVTEALGATEFAKAPWSEAEWAVALLFVELLQAQLGRQVAYYEQQQQSIDISLPLPPPSSPTWSLWM